MDDRAARISYDDATALVVVDMQNDFADPDGSLYVAGTDDIVELVNTHLQAARSGGSTVVLTQDWHPPETPHFVTGGGPWPPHCVRETWGAELHPDLGTDADLVLRKGTGGEDGYSAFTVADPTTGDTTSTGLAAYLDARAVTRVVVVGVAGDVCVRATALDAAGAGFDTEVPWDATASVDPDQGAAGARADLADAGVAVS